MIDHIGGKFKTIHAIIFTITCLHWHIHIYAPDTAQPAHCVLQSLLQWEHCFLFPTYRILKISRPIDIHSCSFFSSQTLNIWAYPKSTGKFEDTLLCCIRHNPDPVCFKICCFGAEPDLKVDKKLLEFKKVLLHRKQTNVLHLHNKTLLPVAWKLGGLEQLGDDFSFSQTHGIVQPLTDFPLSVHFRSVTGMWRRRGYSRQGVNWGGGKESAAKKRRMGVETREGSVGEMEEGLEAGGEERVLLFFVVESHRVKMV